MLLTVAFWRAIWRTFFLQATWNFERMQNLGFIYAMLPVLRHLFDEERVRQAIRRHGQFFNTHPYFASTIVGAMAKLEEDAVHGPDGALERNMNALKLGLMGSLGAIGDSLFWAALRPFAAWLALGLCLFGEPRGAVITFLLLYNLPHLIVRFGGGAIGYAAGLDVVRQLRRVDFPHLAQRLKGAAVFAAFATLPFLTWGFAGARELRSLSVFGVIVVFFLIGRGIGGTRVAAGILSISVIAYWIWQVAADSY